jgi:hypothetical protein
LDPDYQVFSHLYDWLGDAGRGSKMREVGIDPVSVRVAVTVMSCSVEDLPRAIRAILAAAAPGTE